MGAVDGISLGAQMCEHVMAAPRAMSDAEIRGVGRPPRDDKSTGFLRSAASPIS